MEFEEIARRVAAHAQLGEHHQVGIPFTGFPGGIKDLPGIPFEIPDHEAELCERDLHAGLE